VVSTGFPHRRDGVDDLVERVHRLLTHCSDIRRGSSPALDIAWVAAGRLDAHTDAPHPWDVAAAGLIATEAGAVRSARGALPPDLRGAGYLVSAPAVHDDLAALLTAP
jgi:myo-inositol-1(or 4)-monophosphatase